jgi:hypothetical protein
MSKRVVAAALWFVSLSALGGFADVFFGAPSDLGGYAGIAVAFIALTDPTGHMWARRRAAAARVPSAVGN